VKAPLSFSKEPLLYDSALEAAELLLQLNESLKSVEASLDLFLTDELLNYVVLLLLSPKLRPYTSKDIFQPHLALSCLKIRNFLSDSHS